jgi:uronate dehydrogenase
MTPRTDAPAGRLLVTGAAGALGRVLAPALRTLCRELLLSDLPGPLQQLAQHGSQGTAALQPCDLADSAAVQQLLAGVDTVLHLGGISVEGPFAPILQANILGLHHLYEAARLSGTRRIVFASSNHVSGCHPRGATVHADDPPRPDGHYGLSKLFGEGLARLYWDRHGLESVCLRIGTATETPPDRRALSTWLSHGDLLRLVRAALTAPDVGCTVAYGVSANTRSWWRSPEAWQRLGYTPQDNAEGWASLVEHIDFTPGTPMARLQGGSFLGIGPSGRTGSDLAQGPNATPGTAPTAPR